MTALVPRPKVPLSRRLAKTDEGSLAAQMLLTGSDGAIDTYFSILVCFIPYCILTLEPGLITRIECRGEVM